MATISEERVTLRVKEKMPFLIKSTRGRGTLNERTGETAYRAGTKICMERPRLVTEAYRETEGEPYVLRRAKALAKYLDNMTIYIQPWERIVGNFVGTPDSERGAPRDSQVLAQYSGAWQGEVFTP